MNEIKEKYLPLGTVVRLKGGDKRVMIIGFCCMADDNRDTVWDYMGCVYPEGVMTTQNTLMFDHSQIEEVSHMGLVDDEEKTFKENLKNVLEKINEEKNKNNIEATSDKVLDESFVENVEETL